MISQAHERSIARTRKHLRELLGHYYQQRREAMKRRSRLEGVDAIARYEDRQAMRAQFIGHLESLMRTLPPDEPTYLGEGI